MELNNNNLSDERDDQTIAQQPVPDTRSNGMREVREGQPAGGHKFGEDGNPTPMGDDKDNPSRNAGYTNGYFARTAPSDEDTANNNFKAAGQGGEPDYDKAHTNIPGPQEVPDQQKVGEDNQQEQQQQENSDQQQKPAEPDHIET